MMQGTARQVASALLPTAWGEFQVLGFEREVHDGTRLRHETAMVLIMGDLRKCPPLVRIHSQCVTGDVFGSLRCDCGEQLRLALSMIAEEKAGIVIYEEQEGRGIGLLPKLQAYELQDRGYDTVEANEKLGFRVDYRDFVLPSAVLQQLGFTSVRLLTNNQDKILALQKAGITVVERVPCEVALSRNAIRYLKAKKEKLGQWLTTV